MIIGAFDIETIPAQNLPDNIKPQFDPESVKYGNAGPDKRAEKEAKERAEFDAKLDKRMSVSPALCNVCTFVGIQYDTEDEAIIKTVTLQWGIEDDEEFEAVWEGWDFIKDCFNNHHPLVSYNGIGFDLPILMVAAMRLDIPISNSMYSKLVGKWEGNIYHYDLMLMLAGWDKQRWEKLGFWLRRFDIGRKTQDMDGSEVYPAFKAEEYQKILNYCHDDVVSTYKLMVRVAPWLAPEKEA